MTVLTATFHDIANARTKGTALVLSQEVRQSSVGKTLVTTQQHEYDLVEGVLTTDELDPGRIRVEVEAAGFFHIFTVTLPPEGTHDLYDLEEQNVTYDPPVLNEVREYVEAIGEALRWIRDQGGEVEEALAEVRRIAAEIEALDWDVSWEAVLDKPGEFPPEKHEHVSADITDATCCSVEDTIIRRDGQGLFTVSDPAEDGHPVSKGWAEAAISAAMESAVGLTPEQIELIRGLADWLAESGESGDDPLGAIVASLEGKLDKSEVSTSADAGSSVVRRNSAGQIEVPSMPSGPRHAPPRLWVEDQIAASMNGLATSTEVTQAVETATAGLATTDQVTTAVADKVTAAQVTQAIATERPVRIEVVSSVPAVPDANTLYVIPEVS